MHEGRAASAPAPRRRSRMEIWLLIAVSIFGLLGFMSTLSTGDEDGGAEPSASQAPLSAAE